MSNIYDIFNERKNAVSMISEGFDMDGFELDIIEDFDSIEEGIDVLTDIQREMKNATIKLCAESYVSDLLIEAAMDENFDEEELNEMIEESLKEKASGLGEKIQGFWAKIKAWFSKLFENIKVQFSNGEKLRKQYDLNDKLKSDNGKVKTFDLIPLKAATNKVDKMMSALPNFDQAAGPASGDNWKEFLLGKVGVKDRSELKKKVMGCFTKNGQFERKEVEIKSMFHAAVIDYACNKKDIIDGLNQQQKKIDEDFKAAMDKAKDSKKAAGDIENKEKRKNAVGTQKNIMSVLNFMIDLKTDMVKAEIAMVKKLSGACLSILHHACGHGAQKVDAKAEKEAKKEAKKAEKEAKAKTESFDYIMQSLNEELEFDDNNNDFNDYDNDDIDFDF